MKRISLSIFLLSLVQSLGADDGQKLFNLHCASCHSLDGQGGAGGSLPPLAGSEWLLGDPSRSIAIVLFGLKGPIEVNKKPYNLEMPPQGVMLTDAKISAILNYVNTAWGNEGQSFDQELVSNVRKQFSGRKEAWTAPELLKLYPLPNKGTPLKKLTSQIYLGQWDKLPDFSSLKAENIEEENDNIIDPSIAPHGSNFGVVWKGEFHAETDGSYEFILGADDGARIIINDEILATVDGTGPLDPGRSRQGKIDLKKGAHTMCVEYFQGGGDKGLSLGWKTGDMKTWEWLTPAGLVARKPYPDLILTPEAEKTVIYRNFIEGTSPRAIGFGFPGGLNLAYSADHLAPELVWSGNFINAGRHWTDRGVGNEPPAGEPIHKLTSSRYLPEKARFRGYSLDPQGNPTFFVSIGNATLRDFWKPGKPGTLVRTLSLVSRSRTPSSLAIPTGNAPITGAQEVILKSGSRTSIIYKLK